MIPIEFYPILISDQSYVQKIQLIASNFHGKLYPRVKGIKR